MARYALVIGIATYDNFRSLPKVATDAEAIARLLEQHSYQVTRLPKKLVAENQQAIDFDGRLENIHLIQELKTFVRERGHQQEALIFFAGHGFRVTNSITDELEGYLATSDTTKEGKNAIPLKDLNALISQSELSSLVMLLDCCYVGLLGEQYNLLQSTQAAIRYKPNYCLIAACRNLEEAGEEQQHSIFTAAVLNGLSTVRAANSEITSIDLFSTVSQELQTNGRDLVQATIGWAIPIAPCLSQELDAVEIDESETPYCGLEPFGENHAKFFCGRKQLIKDIWEKLNQTSLAVIIGSSGCGKSSAIRAGLIPLWRSTAWQVLPPIKPGSSILARLFTTFDPFFKGVHNQRQLSEFIHNDSNGLDQLARHLPEQKRYLLVVDQFEELFTLSPANERQRFIELLAQVAEKLSSRLAIVLAIRADFLESCLQHSALVQLIQTQAVYIPPLKEAERKQVITEPAQRLGYTFEAGLVRKILDDVDQELSCLPLLQFTLLKLWEKRDRRKQQLAYSAYLEMGGVLGALNHHAEWVYKRLSPSAQDWIKWICLKLVRADAEIKDTRQRQPKQRLLELAGDNPEHLQLVTTILQQLIDERLLISEEEEGEVWVDLVHESLMDGWNRFAEWRQETWEQRQITVRLEDALHSWQKTPTNDNLADSRLLQRIRENWHTLEPELDTDVKEFYQRSVDYHNKQAFLAKLEPDFGKARDEAPIFPAKESLITQSHQETREQKQPLARQENIEKVLRELQKKDIPVINIFAGDYINVGELNNCEGVALGRDAEATSKKEQATNQDE